MITSVNNIGIPASPELTKLTSAGTDGSFKAVLQEAVQGAEQTRVDAGQAVTRFLNGEDTELHTTVLAAQKAELSFELFLQVRNKVVQAYQEVMRSQI